MRGKPDNPDEELIEAMDDAHRQVGATQRQMFRLIAEADRRRAWRDSGALGVSAGPSGAGGIWP